MKLKSCQRFFKNLLPGFRPPHSSPREHYKVQVCPVSSPLRPPRLRISPGVEPKAPPQPARPPKVWVLTTGKSHLHMSFSLNPMLDTLALLLVFELGHALSGPCMQDYLSLGPHVAHSLTSSGCCSGQVGLLSSRPAIPSSLSVPVPVLAHLHNTVRWLNKPCVIVLPCLHHHCIFIAWNSSRT